MVWCVLSAFLVALLAPTFHARVGRHVGWLLAIHPLAVVSWMVMALPLGASTSTMAEYAWIPALGIELAFVADGLSLSFAFLVLGIGALVVLYASGYLGADPRLGRFYAYFFVFMGAMLGMVFSDNLIVLFVFWEMTSVASYLLIGFNHESKANRASALKALLVTGGGGLALLAGLLLLGIAAADQGLEPADALRVSAMLPHAQGIHAHALYPAALLLICLGVFTKSAQVPFHFWLPSAMAGPTPVSAYLHSATMVKAGVFLLARLHPVLGGTDLWFAVLTLVGMSTMVVGALMAAGQRDLKGILAYTTISVLGTLVTLLGVGSDDAIQAAVVFLFAHAFYKAALFMIVGNVDHGTGSRDITKLGGLRRIMPWTAAAALMAALSKAGAPPMFGYVGKKLIFDAKFDVETLSTLLIAAAIVANICMVAVAFLVAVRPFWGEAKTTPHEPHEAGWPMLIGPLVLAALGLFVGLVPAVFDATIGTAMASAIKGDTLPMKLKLVAGMSPDGLLITVLSAAALLLGVVLYRLLHVRVHPARGLRWLTAAGPNAMYDAVLRGVLSLAAEQTRRLQPGSLTGYVFVTMAFLVITVAVLGGSGLVSGQVWPGREFVFHQVAAVVLVIAGAVAGAVARSAMVAVAALGVTGLGIALTFAMFGAVDLAITQLMVETLMVLVLVLVLVGMSASAVPARPVVAPLVLFSIFVLVRGHNEPGGGFIGGLILAAAFALIAMSFGVEQARRALRATPQSIVGAGLLLAIASGCVGLVRGQPLLTAQWWAYVPGVGKFGTVLLFDIGVYLVVVGTTMLVVFQLLGEGGEA